MSKVGNKSIIVPSGTEVTIVDSRVDIKGPQGQISLPVSRKLSVTKEGEQVFVSRYRDDTRSKSIHGLTRSLLANAIVGVNKKWEKILKVVGTGYKVRSQGDKIIFDVGYSHSVEFTKISGIDLVIEGNDTVRVLGADKQLVGEVAFSIKKIKKPDPYKGKGIRY